VRARRWVVASPTCSEFWCACAPRIHHFHHKPNSLNQVINYEDNGNYWASQVGEWAQTLQDSASEDSAAPAETPDGGQCRFPSPLPTHTRVHTPKTEAARLHAHGRVLPALLP
jgi:hypothetical protein